jgi:hypothetical protein
VCGYVGESFGAFERQNQSDYTNVVERMFKRKGRKIEESD